MIRKDEVTAFAGYARRHKEFLGIVTLQAQIFPFIRRESTPDTRMVTAIRDGAIYTPVPVGTVDVFTFQLILVIAAVRSGVCAGEAGHRGVAVTGLTEREEVMVRAFAPREGILIAVIDKLLIGELPGAAVVLGFESMCNIQP